MQAGGTSLNALPPDDSSRNHARGGFQKFRDAKTRRLNQTLRLKSTPCHDIMSIRPRNR